MTDTHTDRAWSKPPEVEAILAIGSLALFSWVTWAVIFRTVPAENEKYAMLMLGALIGVVKDTFGRYFQATKGAQEQRKDAAKVAEKAAETAAVLATATASAAPAPGTATVTAAPDVDITVRDADQLGETNDARTGNAAAGGAGGGAGARGLGAADWRDNPGEGA